MGPLTRAVALARAARPDAEDFRAFFGRAFEAWALTGRRARGGKGCHRWRRGVRLRPAASGELPQRIYDLSPAPPRIRRAGSREVAYALRCGGQVEYPPSVAPDAKLGYSVLARQSAELLFGQREGSGEILVRLEGACARAHEAGKTTKVAQRAKVGELPAQTAHPSDPYRAPSRFAVGGPSQYKARGDSLWMGHGHLDVFSLPPFSRKNWATSRRPSTGRPST